MTSTKRAGEDYVYPLPAFRALPPLPPVRTVDPDKYMGMYTYIIVDSNILHDNVN